MQKNEIERYLRHHTEISEDKLDMKEVEWWVNNYPVISHISKRNASEFMANVNHILAKAGMDMLGTIQDFNYYKKFWGDDETCKRFVKAAIKVAETYNINVGISQNNNEAIIILKDFA